MITDPGSPERALLRRLAVEWEGSIHCWKLVAREHSLMKVLEVAKFVRFDEDTDCWEITDGGRACIAGS